MKPKLTLCQFAFILLASCSAATDEPIKNEYFTINEKAELIRPADYRSWMYVGAPITPNDMNDGKAPFPEFHNVYIDPISYQYYKETGEFQEGTILVKELISAGTKQAASGNGYFMGEYIGLEATIKSQEHFPDEPGNWAYFSFTNSGETELKGTAEKFETKACNSCHQASAVDDFVFTQYYPVLQSAKNYGQGSPENESFKAIGESPENKLGVSDNTSPATESSGAADISSYKKEILALISELSKSY